MERMEGTGFAQFFISWWASSERERGGGLFKSHVVAFPLSYFHSILYLVLNLRVYILNSFSANFRLFSIFYSFKITSILLTFLSSLCLFMNIVFPPWYFEHKIFHNIVDHPRDLQWKSLFSRHFLVSFC